ncbi:hypothetical protein Pyn_12441 [Prunus yedoensis var. nudiflora]|uniref:Uncharacterized protein n=1 Tax=Prunus yedoensis var. nudiflora TaxID=2094558 RepID=A0A314ZGE9_PRUYE|nr:hypothetical protein Pyn_12441 [Prunus yedoensis var. nudiflora]
MHFLSSLLEAPSHQLVLTTFIGSLTPRFLPMSIVVTDGVWDALKVQIALIAWIMVALLLLGVAWVTCSPPFSAGYWFLFGGCRLAMVAQLVAE